MKLVFDDGTLMLREENPNEPVPTFFRWDERVERWRAPAYRYREVVAFWKKLGVNFQDEAAKFRPLSLKLNLRLALPTARCQWESEALAEPVGSSVALPPHASTPSEGVNPRYYTPRPYQREALEAWESNGRRGVVVLPTGTGKTLVALMAIEQTQRSTLVVVPTIPLMKQWHDDLHEAFGVEVGALGGGEHRICELTVTTYQSACNWIDRYGNLFGLLVFDEVHHLFGEIWSRCAEHAIAPFRLGLTATPQRSDGRHRLLDDLVGAIVYKKGVREMSGAYLSEYEVKRISVPLTAEERVQYHKAHEEYGSFLREKHLSVSNPEGFQRFVLISSKSEEGRRALLAYQRARSLAFGTESKLRVLANLLQRHARDKVLIFTKDNAMVYTVSRRFLIPAITQETKTKERKETLDSFKRGEYLSIVSSEVLDEGVNVPDANVAIVLGGTGSTRQHVQRLGRILRPRAGKQAVLYEIVAQGTIERYISNRRRQHDAYGYDVDVYDVGEMSDADQRPAENQSEGSEHSSMLH